MSYVDGPSQKRTPLSRWANVYLAGYTLMQACLNLHSRGGAAMVDGNFSAALLPS